MQYPLYEAWPRFLFCASNAQGQNRRVESAVGAYDAV